jgi:hypothetical protein
MSEPVETPPATPPPRAFTQGLGIVFQTSGVILFLSFFTLCCLSGLLSMNTATQTGLGDAAFHGYSGQRAVSIAVVVGVVLGMALAGVGLGLQAERRGSPAMGVVVTLVGALFWLIHLAFFAGVARSVGLSLVCLVLTITFAALFILAMQSVLEMRRTPPPPGAEILSADYKVPYSHLHQDPPEVRLAKELEERRRRLEVQQAELKALEQKLHRKLEDESL